MIIKLAEHAVEVKRIAAIGPVKQVEHVYGFEVFLPGGKIFCPTPKVLSKETEAAEVMCDQAWKLARIRYRTACNADYHEPMKTNKLKTLFGLTAEQPNPEWLAWRERQVAAEKAYEEAKQLSADTLAHYEKAHEADVDTWKSQTESARQQLLTWWKETPL